MTNSVADIPGWVQGLCGVLMLVGAALALLGAIGIVRLPLFFQRIHATTLASTFGAWSIAFSAALYFSFAEARLALHPVLVPALLALTVPVSTFFLMRAAVFRHRLAGTPGVPENLSPDGPEKNGDDELDGKKVVP